MNKKNYLIFFIFCICTHSFATKVSKPFLYEVQKDGKTSYILGSIHIGIGVSDLPPWVNELHKRAKTHSYEIDFGAGESIEDFKFMQNLFLFKNSDISISHMFPKQNKIQYRLMMLK